MRVEFRELTEDQNLDSAYRAEALRVYSQIRNFLENKFLEDKFEESFIKRTDGSYAAYADDIGAPSRYSELIIIFAPKDGSHQLGAFGFLQRSPTIIQCILSSKHNSYNFFTYFSANVFVHEFIHYLDFKRYKSSGMKAAQQIPAGNITIQQYVNTPAETNAYYQEVMTMIDASIRKGGHNSVYAIPDFTVFSKAVLRSFPMFFVDNLNRNNQKKLLGRLYNYFSEVVLPLFGRHR